MSKSRTSFRRRLLRAGIATAAATATVAAGIATPAFAANVPLTLTQTSASATLINSPGVQVVASSSTAWLADATASSAKAVWTTATTCANTYSATGTYTAIGDVLKYSNTRGSVTLTGINPSSTTTYRVCFYAGTSNTDVIIGSASFTVFVAPTLGTAAPSTGPSSGGTTVTFTGGTGLPTTAAGYTGVTVGGVAATDLKPINATSFSFVTPARAAGAAQDIVVNFASGASVTAAAAFTHYNAITVTPNAGTFAVDTPVYITGGGFNALNPFGATNTASAHIFLNQGPFTGAGAANAFTTAPQTDCTNPVKLSDTEIICTLAIGSTYTSTSVFTLNAATDVARGAYTVFLVNDATIGAMTGISQITPSSTFTVSSY